MEKRTDKLFLLLAMMLLIFAPLVPHHHHAGSICILQDEDEDGPQEEESSCCVLHESYLQSEMEGLGPCLPAQPVCLDEPASPSEVWLPSEGLARVEEVCSDFHLLRAPPGLHV